MIVREINIEKSPHHYSIENIRKIAILSIGSVDREIISEKQMLIEAKVFVCPIQAVIEDKDEFYNVKLKFICIYDNCSFRDLCSKIIEDKLSKFRSILPLPEKRNEDVELIVAKILKDGGKSTDEILNELLNYSLSYCPDSLIQILLRMEKNGKIRKKLMLPSGKYLWYV
jgi:predicted lactoylglutathione lyase